MNRTALFALLFLLLAGALAAWSLGLVPFGGTRLMIARTLFDSDADGTPDLIRVSVGDLARLWRWDRDNDGNAEIIAYDVTAASDGELRPGGSITAWDIGADGILEEGRVPERLQQLLASEKYAQAEAAAGEGTVELVDERVRALIEQMRGRYDDWRLSGFRLPIVGASLPDADRLLPGAPRRYRSGVHQGFDMYPGHIGVPSGYGGPVVAAKDGVVIRADHDYREMTPEQYAQVIARSQAAGTTPPEELDLLRGRQVWIDHGHGIVTRYAHLSAIPEEIVPGARVQAGEIVGFVGNSGMEAAAQGARTGAHLHFELRIDDHYFGEGMSAVELRELARRVFGLSH